MTLFELHCIAIHNNHMNGLVIIVTTIITNPLSLGVNRQKTKIILKVTLSLLKLNELVNNFDRMFSECL